MSSLSDNPLHSPTVVVEGLAAPRDGTVVRSPLPPALEAESAQKGGLRPEDLLAEWPSGAQPEQEAASAIFQDFCKRRQKDPHATSVHEAQEGLAGHGESMDLLVREDALLASLSGPERSSPRFSLPEVGDRLFGFRLLHELGRGSFARVFLAAQDDLASRPVVLKVSNLEGDEPQTMAMLQHTHIVPIHSVHEDRRAGLRAVCMPYFGGASLSAVLREAGVSWTPVRSGEELVRALKAVQAPLPQGDPTGPAPALSGDPKVLALLGCYSYVQAAAWVIARLAEGLQHSHSRGVLHRDIKPSNVLLGMDGQPMLLDFNLAQVNRGEQVKVVLGGTINYMAPEHLRSLASRDPAVAREVDHRADIYSLGMVLFEMLVGRRPFAQSASYTPLPLLVEAMAVERGKAPPSLRGALPDSPWDLDSIVRKCLAPSTEDRYQQAEHLAEDLDRFLDDRPLRYAPEVSLRQRYRKWRRRHPRLATAGSVGTVAVVLLATLGAALMGSQRLLAVAQSQLGQTQESLARAEAQDRKRAFQAQTVRALCLVSTTSDGHDQLQEGRAACEEALGLYQVLQRDDWQEQPAWCYLDEADRLRLAEDVRELLLLLAWATAEKEPGNADSLRQALSLLDRCEALTTHLPFRALWEDRALYLERLGKASRAGAARAKAAACKPSCARDHYLLATSLARKGRHAGAVAELTAALRLNPDHYWSLVQRGICYRELGEHLLAAGDFSRCAGLVPRFAWGHYNLGCILDQGQKREQAIACYDDALRCDGSFGLGYLNRGLALLDLGRFPQALADLDRASRCGRDDALLHLGRGAALEGLSQPSQADAAFAVALRRLEALPPARKVLLLLRFAFAVHRRRPDAAEKAFVGVLGLQAHHPQALYGQAMLLTERGREPEAIACFNEALRWHPSFVDARRSRAVLLARHGNLAEAQDDINRCLQQQPEAGITLYAAACVLARAAAQSTAAAQRQQREDQALDLLGRAFQRGYGRDRVAADPDLVSLLQRREARDLLGRQPAP
jgi:serine/threonine protein kinase/lipoprotein NlpI